MKTCIPIKHKLFQESVRFRDVAVVFSSNQWVHLSFQERELYRDVMLDTCDYIASLGKQIFPCLKRPRGGGGRGGAEFPCDAAKDQALSLQQLRLLLWCMFNP